MGEFREEPHLFAKQEGSYTSSFKKIRLLLHGFENEIKNISVNGIKQEFTITNVKLLDGLEYLGDYYDKDYYKSLRSSENSLQQLSVTFDNTTEQIIINW